MKKAKPLLDFVQLPPLEKVGFCRNVSGHLASDPVFLNPTVPLDEVNAAIDAFEVSILNTHDGSRTAKAIMREHELIINTMFTTLNAFVNTVANGNEAILRSSGFNVLRQPVSHVKAVLAINYTEHSGCLEFDSARIDKVVAYIWQIYMGVLPIAETDWVPFKTTTQCKCTIEGLTPGLYITVRVAYVSSAGTSDFGAPVTILII
ncbi:MAG: fibronectin type III domain-containing protein [Methylococcales bacterium]